MKSIFMTCSIAATLFAGVAMAGTCEIMITRTACPGKEDISFKKCNGKASCSEFEDAADLGACRVLATNACANNRLSITKSKVIGAKFDDKAITAANGDADFCKAYVNRAAEFDHCDK